MSMSRHIESTRFGGSSRPGGLERRYLGMVAGGAVLALIALGAVYGSLHQVGRLPPPPLSNNVCVDEKLAFLRNNPPSAPNFLVIGSSVAWRNFDSSVVADKVPGARPLNGAFCGMQVHQSAFISRWLIDQFPSVEDVLLIVSPRDYKSCRGSGQAFDPVDASKLVFERKWIGGFYLRYFDPLSLIRNIREQAKHRSEALALGFAIEFTAYGDGPADTTEDRGLYYGPMPEPDPACFAVLRSLAMELAQDGRRFMFVTTALHPEWKARYDADGSFMNGFMNEMTEALQGTGAAIWDGDEAAIDAAAFTDAVHMRWSAADDFTNVIIEELL